MKYNIYILYIKSPSPSFSLSLSLYIYIYILQTRTEVRSVKIGQIEMGSMQKLAKHAGQALIQATRPRRRDCSSHRRISWVQHSHRVRFSCGDRPLYGDHPCTIGHTLKYTHT